jgi:apolipoprotein N-acyltransferase
LRRFTVHELVPALLALAGGAIWALCFARQPLNVVSWVALVPLLLLLGHRRAWILGFLHGLAFWLVSVPWIAPTLETYGQLPPWLAGLAIVGVGIYQGSYTALFAFLAKPVWQRGGALALLGPPALWVAVEWLRAHLLGGFPWNLAANAWVDLPGALPLSAWIGCYGISLLLLLTNNGVARAVVSRRWQPAALTAGPTVLLLAFGVWSPAWTMRDGHVEADPVRVLQPNIQNLMEWDRDQVEANYRKLLELSDRACNAAGALVIWPESAAWPYSYGRDAGLRADVGKLVESGCSVLLNSVLESAEGDTNSALLVTPTAEAARYDKRRLVPFGEFVPLAEWLPFMDSLARNAGDFAAGRSPALLSWEEQEIGTAICFEIVFPAAVAEQVRHGATLLVTITNDAWYGDTWAPWQHFRGARFRAAENRRTVLRAAITGVSAVIGPDGSVQQMLGVGEEGILEALVAGRSDLTLFARAPWLVPFLCCLGGGFAIFVGRRR